MSKKVGFALYIAACYFAVVLGHAFVDHELAGTQIVLDPAQTAVGEKTQTSNAYGADSVNIESSSKSPPWLLLLGSGVGVFAMVLLFLILLPRKALRGGLILGTFAISIICVNGISRNFAGLGFWPSVSVLLVAFFYGALFWWIDGIAPDEFDGLLAAIRTGQGTEKVDKLKLLYDCTKNHLVLVITLFLSVCVTLAWNINTVIKEDYAQVSQSRIMSGWMIWLVFWGSLGLLGGAGREFARRMGLILEALK
jgi:hypothetical protein